MRGGARLAATQLRGTDISFALPAGNGRVVYKGQVSGDRMEGTADIGGGKSARWSAARSKA